MIRSRQLNAISSNRCGSFARGRGGTEVRAEWFSINNAISQAVLTNPGVGEGRTKTDRAGLRRGWE